MITEKEIEVHVVSFFRAYLAFSETGDNPMGFNTHDGLCIAKYRYVESLGLLDEVINGLLIDIGDYMDNTFINEGLCPDYPFGKQNYIQRYSKQTQHKCPNRLRFIRNFLAEKDV